MPTEPRVRESVCHAEAIEGTLAELQHRAEKLPEGNSLRVTVETFLGAVEKQVSNEVDALRRTVGSRKNR